MHTRKAPARLAALTTALALAVAAPVFAAQPAASTAAQTQARADIVDTAVAAGQFRTLAAALQAAGLVDTLKGAGPFTVFAPTDAAFAALPAGTVENLLKPENREQLVAILTYHVVPGKISPDEIVGTHKTVQGGSVTVTGTKDALKVDSANVVCGGVMTANATVYMVDSVLMPK